MPRRASRAGRSSATFSIGWSDRMTEQPRTSGTRALPQPVHGGAPWRGEDGAAPRPERLPDPDGVLHPEDRARGADPRRGHRRAQELPVRGSGGAAGVRGALLRPSRRQISAHDADQHRHGLLHHLPAGLLSAGAVRRPARDDLLRLDRHLQPDDRRAVLVVRQRRVLEGGRRASARHRRPGRVARRGRRGSRGRSSH